VRNLWRISNYASLDGVGGLRYSARWHTSGKPIVYLAESAAGAMLEILVHLELSDAEIPQTYTLLRVEIPESLSIEEIKVPEGDAWKADHSVTRRLGDDWLAGRRMALARVPSAILPMTSNYILNPLHPDSARVKIVETTLAEFDLRLLRHLR
jgi:RES domain-containing protein